MDMEHNLVFEGMDEDDVFYAEIRRQILLLTADDDDEDEYDRALVEKDSNAAVPSKERLMTNRLAVEAQPAGNYYYFSRWENDDYNNGGRSAASSSSSSVPAWLVSLWRSGNGSGTGVFIPHAVKSSRRRRPRRKNNNGRKRIYKQVDQSKQG